MAFVEDEHHALIAQRFQPGQIVAFVAAVERQAELLDGGDDHLVGVVVGEQPPYKRFGIGVFFDALFLKFVEFFPRLPVEVFAVHHEQAFVDVRVVLEQGRCLEGGERFAAAGGVPDVAVAAVLVDAIDNGLDGVDLVGAHHQEFLLTGHQHHVAADHFTQRAFGEEFLGEAVQMGDLVVVFACELVERQKAFVGVEAEVAVVIVGKVPGIAAVADDEQLQETQQGFAITVAGVALVINDLLHGPARADGKGFQLDLHHRQAVDEQNHIIAMVAVVSVDAQLVDQLEAVLAPVLDVDQGVKKGCAVITLKAVEFAQVAGGRKNIQGNDLLQQPVKLAIGEVDAVQGLEMLAEVLLQRGAVTNVLAVVVFEVG
ncbi:hypothetical protein SAMN05428977_100513 [Nitrosomonas sp. Nm166]|nr:hypothetical protein SAMN05428977_100513 [Nitrosomonas sp. Nm166]